MKNIKQNPIVIILAEILIVAIMIFAVSGCKNRDNSKNLSSKVSTAPAETVSEVIAVTVSETVSSMEPENLGFKVPDEIKTYFSKSLSDVFGSVPKPDGYYGGGAYFYTPDKNYILIYSLDDYDNLVTISGEIGKLIEGKTSCSYAELKEIFGENISEFMQNDIDGGYCCEVKADGFTLEFNSLTSEFETFYINRQ